MEVLCPWALVTFKILPTLDEEVAALSDEVTSPPGHRHLWSWDLDPVCLSPSLLAPSYHATANASSSFKETKGQTGCVSGSRSLILGPCYHARGACQAAHTWEDKDSTTSPAPVSTPVTTRSSPFPAHSQLRYALEGLLGGSCCCRSFSGTLL